MTVREALGLAEARLAAAGVDTSRVDAELLLAHVLGTTRSGLYEQFDQEVDAGWEALLERRLPRSRNEALRIMSVLANGSPTPKLLLKC